MYRKSLTETDINSIRCFLLKVQGRQSKSSGKVPKINPQIKSDIRYVADGKHHLSIKPSKKSQQQDNKDYINYKDSQSYRDNPIYNKYKSMLKNIMKK
jgi:hypothetical protein